MTKNNGTAPKTAVQNEPKTAQAGKEAAAQAPKATVIVSQTVKADEKAAPQAKPPADTPRANVGDVIANIQRKYDILQKLEELRETKKELLAFKFGTSGMREQFQMTDGGSNHFQTHNADFIKAVYNLCLDTVTAKIEQAETEILD